SGGGVAGGRRGRRGFQIGGDEMRGMMLGYESSLPRGMAAHFDHKMGSDRAVKLGERFRQNARRVVFADQPDEYALRAECADIAGDIAGAADLDFAARNREHRRWRFG